MKEYDYVMAKTVSADEAQTHLLDLIREHDEFVITDNGEPVARVVPVTSLEELRRPALERLRGAVQINGDITEPLDGDWDCMK